MKTFTNLLDAYLEARNEYNEARENFQGYDFDYFNHRVVVRLENATNELNDAFEKVKG